MNFSDLYLSYYSKLVWFAKEFVMLEEEAENIIQDVFADLWERRDYLYHDVQNVNAYLFRLVKNRCLDYLKHKAYEQIYRESVQDSFQREFGMHLLQSSDNAFAACEKNETEVFIRKAINSLPKRCRTIFLLSRMEGLKYVEISERLGISVNTVECQMSIALKKLRTKLSVCLAA